MTVEPGGKDTGEVAQEERKSDLEEKERISGEIKVKASLCELSEMSAGQKTHSQVDRLGRTWALQHACMYTIIRNTQEQSDWCIYSRNIDSNIHWSQKKKTQ